MVNKLQLRYTVAFGMVIIVVVIVLAIMFYLQSSSVFSRIKSSNTVAMGVALHGEASKRLQNLSMILSEDLANPLYEFDMLTMFQLLQSVAKLEDIEYVMVVDPNGIVVHDGTEILRHYGQRLSDERVLSWIATESKALVHQKQHILEVVSPILIADELLGWVRIGLSRQAQLQNIYQMTKDMTGVISEFEKGSRLTLVVVTAVLLLFGLILALLISKRLVKPIRQLTDFVLQVGHGNYGIQLAKHRKDELGQLIDACNNMSMDLSNSSVTRRYLDDILNNMHDALTVISEQGRILMVNASAVGMLKKERDKLLDMPYLKLIASKDRLKVQVWLKEVVEHGAEPIDTTYNLHNGQQIPVVLSAAYLPQKGSFDQIICVAQDVSERKRNEAHIRYLAQYDSLTNLPNRQLFRDRLKHAMEQAIRGEYLIAVLFIDLDRFKKINDSIGHQAGDRLLKEAATRLTQLLRLGDTVSRVGGDEFIVIAEQLSSVGDGFHVADLIIEELKLPFDIEGRKLFIGCSIGMTFYPFSDDSLDSLIQKSDMAMYQAKQRGRGIYECYNQHLGISQDSSNRLENELISAVKTDGFYLNYQPLIGAETGQLIAFEALIRWRHPYQGTLMPMTFLSILESSGMIVELGDWVLEKACLEMLSCQAFTEQPIRLNVNVSMHQFNQIDFPERVSEILKKTGFNANLLQLEITESSLVEDFEMSRNAITTLKKLGIKIAVDDFGTGYSAFTYLRDFDLDCLKLDYSFVKDLPNDQYADGICKALIAMAKVMDLNVVAEGVEKVQQLEWLRQEGIDEYQGYLCSPPVELEQVQSFIQQGFGHRVNNA
jgi:diguanylate cyclase (GGDEF)-like protein/PAS domain S-box-containing protein